MSIISTFKPPHNSSERLSILLVNHKLYWTYLDIFLSEDSPH